ncbi:hypothetical protein PENSPDRAFT_691132 [Peniophora sp. CONT]|nr:hypothetical protein PENSPDRAFT_691132 [Peniophora sp. CONT]
MAAASASSGTENWDEDFVFGNGSSPKAQSKPRTTTHTSTPSRRASEAPVDAESTVRASPRRHPPTLATWAEPGPSTPPKRAQVITKEENWDDDFEDHVESPKPRPGSKLSQPVPEPENWDDDFEEDEGKAPARHSGDWDSSDEEDNFGDAEDRTVTARNRRALVPKNAQHSPPPPVPPLPPLPPSQIPGSPAFSTFSMPASSHRDSIGYASMSHVPLRAGSTSALAMLPPSPPMPRERRRLRKKSRPADANVFELLERTEEVMPSPPRPSPPQLPQPLPPQQPESTPARPALLTRGIGSVKKWGARRKRMSTGPSDVIENEATPRASTSQQHRSAHSSPSSRQTSGSSSGWFFRPSGGQQGAEHASGSPPAPDASSPTLKRQRSVAFAGPNQESPTKKGKKAQVAVLGRRPVTPASSEGSLPPSPAKRGQRPASMHMPSNQQGKPTFPRQTSHGAYALGRTSSRSTFSASTDDVHATGAEESHSGPILRGIRRISLVGRHKRNKSASGSNAMLEAHPMPQLPVPQTPVTQPSELLPPIELQPPSPPRAGPPRMREPSNSTIGSEDMEDTIESLLLRPSQEAARSAPHLPTPQSSPGRTETPRASPTTLALSSGGSPQSASLGRATQPPPIEALVMDKDKVPRRNSLGDLKIPSRISAAQVGLKQNMTMVREFSTSVERLKGLLASYASLVSDADAAVAQIEAASAAARPPSRAMSPPAIFKSKAKARTRSNTNPDPSTDPFVLAYYHLDAQYRLTWECAELLVELGTGSSLTGAGGGEGRSGGASGSTERTGTTGRKGRERAVTLAGDEPGPPPLPSSALGWRASTGRSDLSQRQLSLLKEMLNKDGSPPIPDELKVQPNRSWRWGDAMSSTVTLPSEESASGSASGSGRQIPSSDARLSQKTPTKKPSRLGMRGLRDMLKSLTSSSNSNSNANSNYPGRNTNASGSPRFATMGPSVSTDSSLNLHHHGLPRPPSRQDSGQDTSGLRRRAKTSAGPSSSTSSIRAASPPMPTSKSGSQSFAHKSPRRPSIASIFRFAHKDKGSNRTSPSIEAGPLPTGTGTSSGDNSEEDWDRLDEYDDIGSQSVATVRGRKERARSPFQPPPLPSQPVTPRKTGSRSSLSLSLFNNDSQISLPPSAPPPPPTLSPPPAPILVASALPPHALAFTRPTRLSNVEETAEHSGAEAPPARPMVPAVIRRGSQRAKKRVSQSPRRPLTTTASTSGNSSRSGSVRGGHNNPVPAVVLQQMPAALALAPENIRPLVESAREVLGKCGVCVEELRGLLEGRPGAVAQVRV